MERIWASNTTGRVIQDLRQSWDAVGNLDDLWDYGNGGASISRNRRVDYSYDSIGRLTKTQWYKNGGLIDTETTNYNNIEFNLFFSEQ